MNTWPCTCCRSHPVGVYSVRSRTRSAGTPLMNDEPAPCDQVQVARQVPSGQRTQSDCRPGHQWPSASTQTGRAGSNLVGSSSIGSTVGGC